MNRKIEPGAIGQVRHAAATAASGMPKEDLYSHDLSACLWRKSRYSAGEGQCVEIAEIPGGVAVRDSKNPRLSPLRFTAEEWDVFRLSLITGDL